MSKELELREKETLLVTKEDIARLKQQYDMFRELQKQVLEEDVDYGYPSGKKAPGQKPSLYKSGAEKLTRLFNLTPQFEVVEKVERDDFIMYTFKCVLIAPSGRVVGEGYGSCNSKEKKGWAENPWAFQNNILKIAKKRAHVDAVLTGLGASNVFTQDLEDMEEIEEEHKAPEKPAEKPKVEEKATPTQVNYLLDLVNNAAEVLQKSSEELLEEIRDRYGVFTVAELTKSQASEIITELKKIVQTAKTQKFSEEVLKRLEGEVF
ncbi:MAG: hypothetical protein QW512_00450 [Thermofilaceae archaeon]